CRGASLAAIGAIPVRAGWGTLGLSGEVNRAESSTRRASMLDRFTWFRQSAFLYRGDGLTVYIDPWGVTTDDKADVLFITHAHYDHFQPDEIEKVRKRDTKIFAPADVARELSGNVTPVKPGDAIDAGVLKAQAVPAYNT